MMITINEIVRSFLSFEERNQRSDCPTQRMVTLRISAEARAEEIRDRFIFPPAPRYPTASTTVTWRLHVPTWTVATHSQL